MSEEGFEHTETQSKYHLLTVELRGHISHHFFYFIKYKNLSSCTSRMITDDQTLARIVCKNDIPKEVENVGNFVVASSNCLYLSV